MFFAGRTCSAGLGVSLALGAAQGYAPVGTRPAQFFEHTLTIGGLSDPNRSRCCGLVRCGDCLDHRFHGIHLRVYHRIALRKVF